MEQNPRIDEDYLLVGEARAMSMASGAWAVLSSIKPEFLKTAIDKVENLPKGFAKHSLPVLKLILFFAVELQQAIEKNPELKEAIIDAQIRQDMREAMGEN